MPRFTLRSLMLLIAIIAVALGLLSEYPFQTMTTFYVVGLAFIGWLPALGRSKLASRGFVAAAAWLNVSMLVLFAYYPVARHSLVLFASSLVFVPIVPGIGLAWVTNFRRPRERMRVALAVILLTAIPCSMIVFRWPLHLAFHVSSAGLNRVADRVQAGGSVRPGEWAGIYRVWGASIDPKSGDPILVIDTDPAGIFAFTRHGTALPHGPAAGDWFDGGRWDCIDQD